jgi:hypothetical protein
MFQHTIIVKGKPQDLDDIFKRLSFPLEHGEIKRFADPADAPLTDTNIYRLENPKDGVVAVGTTRLEIGYTGDKEKLKQDILARFPKVTVSC